MSLLARLPRLPVPAVFQPVQPALAAEISEASVAFARLATSGGRAQLAGFFVGRVPDGAMRCSPVQPNVLDAEAVGVLVRAARARVAPHAGAVALCVPDPLARVALLQLDALPARSAELQELVAWKLKKQLPYRIDEAQVAWQVLGGTGSASTVLAAAMRRRVLAEYEDLLSMQGFTVGSVTTSTLALAQALPSVDGDALLVHAADSWFSLLWAHGSMPVLLRTKIVPASDREGEARDQAIAAELAPTIEYACQRMGRTAGVRLLVHDATGRGEELAGRLREAAGTEVSCLKPLASAGLPPDVAARLLASSALASRGLSAGASGVLEPA